MMMIFSLFKNNRRGGLIDALHQRVDDAARDPALYVQLGVPDTIGGRFDSVALHVVLLLRRLRRLPAPAGDVAQELVDSLFRHLDASLREMGVGDMGVPKRMKRLAQAFYARAAAYDAVLDSGDEGRLAAVLAEHFGAPEALRALARYTLAAEAALGDRSLEDILHRGPSLPSPSAFAEDAR
jgi:cytochrome b pre-mRNA-processing protein 3